MLLPTIILVTLATNICSAGNDATKHRVTAQTPPSNSDNSEIADLLPFQRRQDKFDLKLMKVLMLSDCSNMIVSPFSVKLLLSLLSEAAGSDMSMHKELTTLLPGIRTNIQARELYGRIFRSLLSMNPHERYAALMESNYFTKVEQLEFAKSAESGKTINDWCANITRNHIKELLKSDDVDESVMIMLSALNFNGYWNRPFPINETVDLPFYVTPTRPVKASFMAVTDTFYYMESQTLNANILRLPYKGHKFSMTLFLPNANCGLDDIIRELESSILHRVQWLMSEAKVHVEIPKFKFDHTSKLNQVLQHIGTKPISTNRASLPGVSRGVDVAGRLQVSKILQKAGIHTNEQGSTVNVASRASNVNRYGGDSTREFIANRPFIFIIEDETTGTLLFVGKVTDPTTFAL